MENQKLCGTLKLVVSDFHVGGKRPLKIGDFKPVVLLQPLNITALLLQEAKLKT